jgi:cytidine deaminase
MENRKLEVCIRVLQTNELSSDDARLRAVAFHAAARAYAPYSRFQVGAAVRLRDGTILEGCNQENVASPSGLCAERVALFHAGAVFPELPVIALALVAVKDGVMQAFVSPCGACRQVMLETEQRYGTPLRVLMCGRDETFMVASAQDLLPLRFFAG